MDLWTFVIVLYVAGTMVFLVPTTRYILQHAVMPPHETFDYALGFLLALTAVPFWPLYPVGWWVIQMVKTDGDER